MSWSKLGASWSKGSELEQAGVRGVSWSKLKQAGGELRGWRELGASWSKGNKLEQAGRLERAGSKLEQAEASWG